MLGSAAEVLVGAVTGWLSDLKATLRVELTERTRAEEALLRSEERNKAVMKAIPDLIFLVDKNGIFLDFEPGGFNPYKTPAEFLGRRFHDVLPPEVAHGSQCYKGQALQTNEVQIFEHQATLDGEVHNYEARFAASGDEEVLILLRDITERKRAEEALRVSEERYRQIYNHTPVMMHSVDRDIRLVNVNDYWLEALGYERSEVIGRSAFEFVTEFSKHHAAEMHLAELFTTGFLKDIEYQLIKKNGEVLDVLLSAIAERDKAGEIVSSFTLLVDVTERKRAEDKVKASLREKEVLLQEINHRVKNNLQIISSLLNLQSKNVRDGQAREIFRESQNRVRSMSLIYEKLYQSEDLARIEFGEYIRSLAVDLFSTYDIGTDTIAIEVSADDVLVGIGGAILFGLIVNELISNSLKHAFPGGGGGEIHIELHSRNDELTLIVSDNGVGIPQELDFRKTGSLGLQLVTTLVNQLEATIELDRSAGTKFKITIPG